MEQFTRFLEMIDGWVWGVPLIVLILAVGIYLTIRLRGLQIRKLPKALKYMVHNEEGGEGEVTSFGALCTALSATIGTGNIVGVATAIVAGGPGALFWMWMAALFGMATKFAEGVLAIKYRVLDETGHALGGPFYYIENGMGKQWKWLAKLFAFFGVGVGILGIGTITQVNGIASAVNNFFDSNNAWTFQLFGKDYSYTVLIAAIIVTVCVALVIIGGIQRIASVSQVIVPFMACIYVAFCVLLLIMNVTKIPAAFVLIIQSAFGMRAVAGGALGAIILAMQKGIARGIFSNEAGLGSAPIAAAAAQTNEPVQSGFGFDDRHVYRHDCYLYHDRLFYCTDRCIYTGLRRCRCHCLCLPVRSAVQCKGLRGHSDAVLDLLCIYDHSRLGLLLGALLGVSDRQA